MNSPLSNNEKAFVEKAILESMRVDKRSLHQFRDLDITFGLDWGSVLVSIGETRVLAQVSCEISTPKTTRPNEGILFINLEFGPMAEPHLESGFHLSEARIQISRILERTLRDSRCIDLESLCISSESKVWNLRVDLNVLNNEGNVMDCASIAAISALAHFRRPDVSSGNNEFIIHTAAEKDFIPTVVRHHPISISFALFNEGKIAVADPTALEERIASSNLVFAINSFNEVCAMHLGGSTLISPDLIFRSANKAAERAKRIVEFIKSTLEQDLKERESGSVKGFEDCLRLKKILSKSQEEQVIERMDEDGESSEESSENDNTAMPEIVHTSPIRLAPRELELLDLDDDVLIEIIDKLDHKSKMQLSGTCKRFEGLIGTNFQFYKNFRLVLSKKNIPIEPHYCKNIRRKFGTVMLDGNIDCIYGSEIVEIIKNIGANVLKLELRKLVTIGHQVFRIAELPINFPNISELIIYFDYASIRNNGNPSIDLSPIKSIKKLSKFHTNYMNNEMFIQLDLKKLREFEMSEIEVAPFIEYSGFWNDDSNELVPIETLESRSTSWKIFNNKNCLLETLEIPDVSLNLELFQITLETLTLLKSLRVRVGGYNYSSADYPEYTYEGYLDYYKKEQAKKTAKMIGENYDRFEYLQIYCEVSHPQFEIELKKHPNVKTDYRVYDDFFSMETQEEIKKMPKIVIIIG